MYLVVHHMLQPLVVGGTDEDLGVELATSEPIVENLGEGQGRGRGGAWRVEGGKVGRGRNNCGLMDQN